MSYTSKNYTEQGGGVTHIGGKLVIDAGGTVEGLKQTTYTLPAATADTLGGVKAKAKTDETAEVAVDESGKLYVPAFPKSEVQADSVATDAAGIVKDFRQYRTMTA